MNTRILRGGSRRTAVLAAGLVALAVLGTGGALHAASVAAPSSPDGGWVEPFAASRFAPPVAEASADAVLVVETGETFPSIQAALDDPDTLDGHTVEVQESPLPAGQTVVGKSVTLRGATGSEVVEAAEDTGSAGDDRAWFLVTSGVDLTVRDLAFDGSGFLVYQAFRHLGTGTFERVALRNILYQPSGPAYAGFGVVAFGGDVAVRDSTFENIGRVGVLFFGTDVSNGVFEGNTYTGKGVGEWLDYGVEYGGGALGVARNNRITENLGSTSDDSGSAGVLVSTLFGPGTAALIESNNLFGNTWGIVIGYTNDDTSDVTARCNRIVGNWIGLRSRTGVPVDAERNWWGCNEGPDGPDCDDVAALNAPVDFDPWLILTLELDPISVPAGGSATATASLNTTSDGDDVSALCTVPDGIPVEFAATGGTMDPTTTVTSGGMATSTFTRSLGGGAASVAVTIDAEAVAAVPGFVIPTAGTWGLLALGLLLGLAGVLALGRL